MFSLDHGCDFLVVIERNVIELSLELPRNFDELPVPFPDATDAFELVLLTDSPASLEFRLGPESENNLPDI